MMKKLFTILALLLITLTAMGTDTPTLTWDFTSLSEADNTLIKSDGTNWEYVKNYGRYQRKTTPTGAPLTAGGEELAYTLGLNFSTKAATDDYRIYVYKSTYADQGTKCFLILNTASATLTIPGLKQNNTVTITLRSNKEGDKRHITASSNATLTSGSEESESDTETSNVTATYNVTADGDVTITPSNGIRIYSISVTTDHVIGKTTKTGYATYSNANPLNLGTVIGGQVYYASAASGNTVTMTDATGNVAAGEGLFVKGTTAGQRFTIDIASTTGTAIAGNLLKGQVTEGTVAASASGANHYVFGYTSATDYGFYNLTSVTTVPAGKAYLELANALSTGAKANVVFNETTGITNVKGENIKDNAVYNLSGMRVTKLTKGIYIKNGHKFIVK